MSRLMLAPNRWLDEGPRPAVRSDRHISGGPIETRGTSHTAIRSAAGQRDYRERRRVLNAARYQRQREAGL